MIELLRMIYENEHSFGYGSQFLAFDQSNRSLKRGARRGKDPKGLIQVLAQKMHSNGSYGHFYIFSVFYVFCFWACVWPMAFLCPILNFCLYLYFALVILMVRLQF
ncbi:hypothetical protein Hanom_Chr09g00851901 [Helianthus anomalus]